MSFIQDVVTLFLPQAWSEAIQRESERWIVTCPACNSVHSLWELGGIRYKAASIQKKIRIRCPGCSSVSMMPLEYQASE